MAQKFYGEDGHQEGCTCPNCGRTLTEEEIAGNIGMVPPDKYAEGLYAEVNPTTLVGKLVKKRFLTHRGPTMPEAELMWVKVERVGYDPLTVQGRLTNEPIVCREYRQGERVTVALNDIVDVTG